jgi:hypothetical protein
LPQAERKGCSWYAASIPFFPAGLWLNVDPSVSLGQLLVLLLLLMLLLLLRLMLLLLFCFFVLESGEL